MPRNAAMPTPVLVPAGAAPRRGKAGTGVLPGFGLSMGYAVLYLSLLVLLPLATLPINSMELGLDAFVELVVSAGGLAAYRLTFGAPLAAAPAHPVFGLIVAWVLVRYRFPCRRRVGALADLPFALPTAVAGIALTALYAGNGWLGGPPERL